MSETEAGFSRRTPIATAMGRGQRREAPVPEVVLRSRPTKRRQPERPTRRGGKARRPPAPLNGTSFARTAGWRRLVGLQARHLRGAYFVAAQALFALAR